MKSQEQILQDHFGALHLAICRLEAELEAVKDAAAKAAAPAAPSEKVT